MEFTYTMASTKFQTLTKLMTETQMSWMKCLPLALLQVRTQLRSNLAISPYVMMFGLPFITSAHEVVAYEEGEINAIKYVKTIAQNLEDLRKPGIIPQSTLLDLEIHN